MSGVGSGGTFTLTDGSTLAVPGLPYPSTCTVTEENSGGADGTTYTVSGVQQGTPYGTAELTAAAAAQSAATPALVANHFAAPVAPPAPGLAYTGVQATGQLKWAGLALVVGVGLLLVARRRRREDA